jgi:hypothetical protein
MDLPTDALKCSAVVAVAASPAQGGTTLSSNDRPRQVTTRSGVRPNMSSCR